MWAAAALVLAAAACQKAPEPETAGTAAGAPAEPEPSGPSVEGKYLGEGVEPDGTPYKAAVEVTVANQVYFVMRQVDEEVPHDGVGLHRGNLLIVGFRDHRARCGVLVYTVNDDGSLSGVLALENGTATGTETLRKTQ